MHPSFEIVSRFETLDAAHPRASRVRIAGTRIRTVDRQGDERSDGPVKTFDLRPFFIVPAFVDAHVHLLMAGLALRQTDLSNVSSRETFDRSIADAAARLASEDPTGGVWLEAWGWSAERWAHEGGETPDRRWLAAAGLRPAIAWRMDRHACVLNDAALRIVEAAHPGLPPLPGGEVLRDEAGRPTGLFIEANAWKQVIPLVPPASASRKHLALREAAAHLHRHGVASVGSMEYAAEIREAILPVAADESVPFRLRIAATILDRGWPLDTGIARTLAEEVASAGCASEALRIIGFKAFADGTLGLRTARMLEDYADRPGERGMLVELALEGHLDAWAQAVWNAGLSPSIHAIGDEAFRRSLDAFERLATSDAPRLAPRIEHCQTVHRDDLARVRGRLLSMQPLHRFFDGRPFEQAMGPARLERFFPFRSLLDHGATLAFGSDWPIVEPDAIAAMRSAITGRLADGSVLAERETISPREALLAHTLHAAQCLGFTDAGSLAPGRRADLAVLDRDPLETDWHRAPPKVVATLVGGVPVFDAEGLFS
ncbi:MAG: amidohydrolase [Phycisphaerales bacterium]